MFITLTVDTSRKKKKSPVRMKRRKISLRKKRSFLQRFRAWRRSVKNRVYKLGDQVAMF